MIVLSPFQSQRLLAMERYGNVRCDIVKQSDGLYAFSVGDRTFTGPNLEWLFIRASELVLANPRDDK